MKTWLVPFKSEGFRSIFSYLWKTENTWILRRYLYLWNVLDDGIAIETFVDDFFDDIIRNAIYLDDLTKQSLRIFICQQGVQWWIRYFRSYYDLLDKLNGFDELVDRHLMNEEFHSLMSRHAPVYSEDEVDTFLIPLFGGIGGDSFCTIKYNVISRAFRSARNSIHVNDILFYYKFTGEMSRRWGIHSLLHSIIKKRS